MKKIISLTTIILTLAAPTVSFADSKYEPIKSSLNYTKSTYDIQFLDTMIANSRQGIMMSEMALLKSQNKDIRSKARAMVDEQKSDITEMLLVRDDVQEKAPESINMGLSGMSSADLNDLSSQSAKNFDRKFLQTSITNREGTRLMSREAVKNAKNIKVRELAENMVTKESGKIAELKEILSNQ